MIADRYRPRYYRLDGSLYPPGMEGTLEWARDFEDYRGRIIAQDYLWSGLWLSTVWMGIPSTESMLRGGPPLIFETMAFNRIYGDCDVWREHWATLDDAQVGHLYLKHKLGSIGFTLRIWWDLIWTEYRNCREWE